MQQQTTNLENEILRLIPQYKIADGYQKELIKQSIVDRIDTYYCYVRHIGSLMAPYYQQIMTFKKDYLQG